MHSVSIYQELAAHSQVFVQTGNIYCGSVIEESLFITGILCTKKLHCDLKVNVECAIVN